MRREMVHGRMKIFYPKGKSGVAFGALAGLEEGEKETCPRTSVLCK